MELDERLREALVERDAARASERKQRLESRAILNALHAVGQLGSQQDILTDVFDAVRPVLDFESAFVLKPGAEGVEAYVAVP